MPLVVIFEKLFTTEVGSSSGASGTSGSPKMASLEEIITRIISHLRMPLPPLLCWVRSPMDAP